MSFVAYTVVLPFINDSGPPMVDQALIFRVQKNTP